MRWDERRRSGRQPCRFRVRFESVRQLKEHYITNIGEQGVFVETFYPLRIGALVDLELVLGDHPEPFTVRGEVVWVRGASEGGAPGMGVRFVSPSSELQARFKVALGLDSPSSPGP